jgi:hypothetical protein
MAYNLWEQHIELFDKYYRIFYKHKDEPLENAFHDLNALKAHVLNLSEYCYKKRVLEWDGPANIPENYEFGYNI